MLGRNLHTTLHHCFGMASDLAINLLCRLIKRSCSDIAVDKGLAPSAP